MENQAKLGAKGIIDNLKSDDLKDLSAENLAKLSFHTDQQKHTLGENHHLIEALENAKKQIKCHDVYRCRIGEPAYLETFERHERLVKLKRYYFYQTRECRLVGPFKTRQDALNDLGSFVAVNQLQQEISTMIC